MENHDHARQSGPTLRDLYADLDAAQLKETEENLERYLELALRIYERILSDPSAYSEFKALTSAQRAGSIDAKGSNPLQPRNE
jgi:hypothetical protein